LCDIVKKSYEKKTSLSADFPVVSEDHNGFAIGRFLASISQVARNQCAVSVAKQIDDYIISFFLC